MASITAAPGASNHVTVEVVKQDLQHAFAKVIAALEQHAPSSEENPSVLTDRAWIGMQVMKYVKLDVYWMKQDEAVTEFTHLTGALDDPFDTFKAALPPDPKLNDDFNPSKSCTLYILPHEIRDLIYDDLIESGHINILHASKDLNCEVKERLPVKRICRFNIDLARYIPRIILQKPLFDTVQHISIRVLATEPRATSRWEHNLYPIRKVAISNIVRKSCSIIIEDHFAGRSVCCNEETHQWVHLDITPTNLSLHPSQEVYRPIIRRLAVLFKFDTVTVLYRFGHRTKNDRLLSGYLHAGYEARRKQLFEAVTEMVKHTLGPGILCNGTDPTHQYLEFHASHFLRTSSDGVPPKLQAQIDSWKRKRWLA